MGYIFAWTIVHTKKARCSSSFRCLISKSNAILVPLLVANTVTVTCFYHVNTNAKPRSCTILNAMQFCVQRTHAAEYFAVMFHYLFFGSFATSILGWCKLRQTPREAKV